MTYNVSMGTLNPTIPTITSQLTCSLVVDVKPDADTQTVGTVKNWNLLF